MTFSTRIRIALVLLVLLTAIASSTAWAERTAIVLLHTNDTHSNFLPAEASWRSDHAMVGGVLALDAAVRAERTRWQHTLLLDAGDVLTGTPLSEIEISGARGGALFEFMNDIGYDAMTLGNHDFDQGTENVERLVDVADFPVLGVNLRHADGSPYADRAGQIFRFGEVSVGIVGVVTESLDNLLPLHVLEDVRVDPVAESIRAWIASLEERPDVLIALTHQGSDEDEALAAAVPELDLIVGGHSHTRIDEPRNVGTTRIVQAGSRMRELGRVRFEVEDGEIVSMESDLVPLFATGVSTDEQLAQVVSRHELRIEEIYGEVIGEAAVRLDRRGSASSLGIWLAETLAEGSGADFGLMNNGGIRANLDAGPITRGDVFAVLPFHNYVTTFELSGSELLQVLQMHAERAATRSRGGIQIGYLTARWKKVGDDIVLAEATCRGQTIDPERTYRGVSADFVVVSQADAYLGVTPKNVRTTSELLATFVEDAIRTGGKVSAQADDRFDPMDEKP